VHVIAVADELDGDFVARKRGTDEAGVAMRHGTHAVEEMRHLPRAGADGFLRLLERRGGVPERDAKTAGDERSRQVETAGELGRERDDRDIGPATLHHLENVARREVPPRRTGRV
jgi:hypothetical protein